MNGMYTATPDNINPNADRYLISGSEIIGVSTKKTETINVTMGRMIGTL